MTHDRKKKILASTVIGAGLLAGSAGLVTGVLAGPASAQAPATAGPNSGGAEQRGQHPRLRRLVAAVVKTSADTIGIDAKALVQDLKDGSTIAEVATAHGVEPQAVIDALVAKADARIDQAVTDGKLTAERAAELKTKVPAVAERAVNRVFDGSRIPKR